MIKIIKGTSVNLHRDIIWIDEDEIASVDAFKYDGMRMAVTITLKSGKEITLIPKLLRTGRYDNDHGEAGAFLKAWDKIVSDRYNVMEVGEALDE